MLSPSAPSRFDETFLAWLRERTEAGWSRCRTITLEEYRQAHEARDCYWRQGTRWRHGLTEAEITAAERRWNLRFPPDYRLFLSMLHTPDRPQIVGFYDELDGELKLFSRPSFYDWQASSGEPEIEWAYYHLAADLLFDVQHHQLWPVSWGRKPATEAGQSARVREMVRAAPKLIPVHHSHRYLLAEPCQEGNPVLSLRQSDRIVYAANFRDYLIMELLDLIDKDLYVRLDEMSASEADAELSERYHVIRWGEQEQQKRAIPFWGELLA